MNVHDLIVKLEELGWDDLKPVVVMIPGDGENTRDIVRDVTGIEVGQNAVWLNLG